MRGVILENLFRIDQRHRRGTSIVKVRLHCSFAACAADKTVFVFFQRKHARPTVRKAQKRNNYTQHGHNQKRFCVCVEYKIHITRVAQLQL